MAALETTRGDEMGFEFRGIRRQLPVFLILIGVAASCATQTRVSSRWISPEYQGGGMHKFLVIGVAETDVGRRTYEDGYSEALRKFGAEAVPSYQLLPTSDQLDRAELEALVRNNGFDGVMVTRLLDVSEQTTVVPPTTRVVPTGYGYGYYGYYGSHYEVVHTPGYSRTTEIVRLETKLWNAEDSQLTWGVTSETFDPKSTSDGVASVTRSLANQLDHDGLVAK
jgi:hypothetical protein